MVVLAPYDGIAVGRWALESLAVPVLAHWSWETDPCAVEVIKRHFQAVLHKGDFAGTSARQVLQELEQEQLPENTVLVPLAGPPCKDHSRTRGEAAPGAEGAEGMKLGLFAKFVCDLIKASRWQVRYLIENVIPGNYRDAEAISEILGGSGPDGRN